MFNIHIINLIINREVFEFDFIWIYLNIQYLLSFRVRFACFLE